jgi:hypothetical protein
MADDLNVFQLDIREGVIHYRRKWPDGTESNQRTPDYSYNRDSVIRDRMMVGTTITQIVPVPKSCSFCDKAPIVTIHGRRELRQGGESNFVEHCCEDHISEDVLKQQSRLVFGTD